MKGSTGSGGDIELLRSTLRRQPDADLPELLFRQRVGWPEAIAALRMVYDCEARRAWRLALSHRGWRRWIELRMRLDPGCRMQAERELRRHGAGALVSAENGAMRIRRELV